MAMKTKLSLAIFLFFLLALFSSLAMARKGREVKDPELETCKHQCRQQHQYTESDIELCTEKCDKYHQMKKEREREIEEEIRRKKEHEIKRSSHHHEEEEEEEEGENPYVFEDQHFDTTVETEGGRVRVLKKFSKLSKFLQGIENFRLAIIEAEPHTFMPPRHLDAEAILFNMKGRGIIGLVVEDKTERLNLESGDIVRIQPGTPFYIVNRDENEKLLLAVFHTPISTPGNYEEFFGPGGRNPESVLTAFSWEVLQAALKGPRKELESLFDQQNEGGIFKIPREQVRAMAPKKSIWPFGGKSNPFNLFSTSPIFANQYGRLLEVGPDNDKSGLQGLNLMLTFANITKRSMTTVYYNTHATKIAVVKDGEGHFEMSCPHVSDSKSKRGRVSYHRISGNLKPGMVFVVPAGHPFVTISSKRNNLQIICFEVNATGNKKLTFAGKNNIVRALDHTAKGLSFNYPPEKVDEIFNRDEQFFFPFFEEPARADA
ncbi:hypothetical protein RJT34_22640 [Clitoria ternatea]|uniref:Cupin type-1 domain-containing protein n=1 Tax=Clitoria ternatea TaxID=43366 RepID=A0AAN9FKE6_CLITE